MNYLIHTVKGQGLVLVVLDGLGDRPVRELRGKTPLEAAKTPVLDRMAREGCCGLHHTLRPGVVSGSAVAHMALFNYGVEEKVARGVFEVLGSEGGIKLQANDYAFRLNFATVKDDGVTVMDRRAQRNAFGLDEMAVGLEKVLNQNPFKLKVIIRHTVGHRGMLLLRGYKNKEAIHDTDPHQEGSKVVFRDKISEWLHTRAHEFLKKHPKNHERLLQHLAPANAILFRGGGRYTPPAQTFQQRNGLKGFAVAGAPLYLGVARYVGMDAQNEPDESRRTPLAIRKLEEGYDFVFVHFKTTDEKGHDGDCMGKVRAIELYDTLLKPLLDAGITVAITGDHATPCSLKMHSGDPVPLLFYGTNVPGDSIRKFGETECRKGSVGTVRGRDVLTMLVNLSGRGDYFLD
ncbi:MAG TPA: 2,3-bisphosphoglycerate-independent phosphoglycerate mutase [archaeon]|nr:2,3-bisphosphoglycerate-independent phosphoglycerate mutase [archaeon]